VFPATFQLPEHLRDVSILYLFIPCATQRLATVKTFADYLVRVTATNVTSQDCLRIASDLQRFLRSECTLFSCFEHASWVRLTHHIRAAALSDANQVVNPDMDATAATTLAWCALIALLDAVPQGDNILSASSAVESITFRVNTIGGCTLEVLTQPTLREPVWLGTLGDNPCLPGLLSGPPSSANSIVDHVATTDAVQADVSRNLLGNPYTVAAVTGRRIPPPPSVSQEVTSVNVNFKLDVDPTLLFDTDGSGTKKWRKRSAIDHLRVLWQAHPDKPAQFGLAFDGANAPKKRRREGESQWSRSVRCTACDAKAVLSGSWEEPSICSVEFKGDCVHAHGGVVNQRVTGSLRKELIKTGMKPMRLRAGQHETASREAVEANNMTGIPTKQAAKVMSSAHNQRFRRHTDTWTSLNIQQEESRAAHATRNEAEGMPPPKLLGSMHHLVRFPPSLTLTSEAKILLADGLLPQFKLQIDFSMKYQRDVDESWNPNGANLKPLSHLAFVIQHPAFARALRLLTIVSTDTTGDASVSALYAHSVLQRKVLGRLLNIRYIMMDMGKNCSRLAAMYLLGINFVKYLEEEWRRLNAKEARDAKAKVLEWCWKHVLFAPKVHIMSKTKFPGCEPHHKRAALVAMALDMLGALHTAPDIDCLNGLISGFQQFLKCIEFSVPNHNEDAGGYTVVFGNPSTEVSCTLAWAHTADMNVVWTVVLYPLEIQWVPTTLFGVCVCMCVCTFTLSCLTPC
jgi:hypothetical protein